MSHHMCLYRFRDRGPLVIVPPSGTMSHPVAHCRVPRDIVPPDGTMSYQSQIFENFTEATPSTIKGDNEPLPDCTFSYDCDTVPPRVRQCATTVGRCHNSELTKRQRKTGCKIFLRVWNSSRSRFLVASHWLDSQSVLWNLEARWLILTIEIQQHKYLWHNLRSKYKILF